jgi:hypothetical protein
MMALRVASNPDAAAPASFLDGIATPSEATAAYDGCDCDCQCDVLDMDNCLCQCQCNSDTDSVVASMERTTSEQQRLKMEQELVLGERSRLLARTLQQSSMSVPNGMGPVRPPVKAPRTAPVRQPVRQPVRRPVRPPVRPDIPTPSRCPVRITGFTLVNAQSRSDIMSLRSFSLSDVPTLLSIRADVDSCSPKAVESVMIEYDGSSRCESNKPYAAFGDSSTGDVANNAARYRGRAISQGTHTIVATPYTGEKCTGTSGNSLRQQFTADA